MTGCVLGNGVFCLLQEPIFMKFEKKGSFAKICLYIPILVKIVQQ
jgi:hypothetical protein